MSIAGVVVLYNPDEYKVIENIKSFINDIHYLIIIDNSEAVSTNLSSNNFICSNEKIEYIRNDSNLGIATALNIGAKLAIDKGCEWLLTMDQDSKASDEMIGRLLAITKMYSKDKIGIIAPRYILQSIQENENIVEEVLTTITSGSLINLKAYTNIGKFRDDLFIDFVDHEYCLRLNMHGYKVLINNQVDLYHQLGNSSSHSVLGRNFITSNHNYIRRYYITRNRLTVINQFKKIFPSYYKLERNSNIIEIIKIFVFEKDKFRKFKSIIKGYLDYKRKKFGRANFNN